MIAEFTKLGGNPVTVNMDKIDNFDLRDENSIILFEDGVKLCVHRSCGALAEVLSAGHQAGC